MQVGNILDISNFTGKIPSVLNGSLAGASTMNGNAIVLNSIGSLGQLHAVGLKNCWENWRIKCTVKLSASTTFGIGQFGEQQSWPVTVFLKISTANNTFSYDNGGSTFTKNITLPVNTNIDVEFKHTRQKNTLKLSFGGTVYTIENGIGYVDLRVGYPAIFLNGGSAEVSSFKFDLLEEQYPTAVMVGASTCKGGALEKYERSWPHLYARRKGIPPHMYNVHAAGASNHADLLACITTMLQYQTPVTVYLFCGSNDDYNNTSSWLPNRTAMVSALNAAGVTIVHLTIAPDVNDGQYYLIRDVLLANFTCINVWNALANSSSNHFGNSAYFKPDGAHPNAAGHDIIQNLIP
jgi:hypothetical protein